MKYIKILSFLLLFLPSAALAQNYPSITLKAVTVNGTANVPTVSIGNSSTSAASTAFVAGTFAAPPALGSTTPAAVSATNLSATGTLTGSTGIMNIGSGQIYKDASGNVGFGTTTPTAPTTNNSFVYNKSGTVGYFGIYNNANSLTYGISSALPSPTGTSTLGGYFNGLGVGGSSNNTASPIFGVLTSTQTGSGIGGVAFTVLDNNKITTYHSTLDDGSGNASFSGNLNAGSINTTPIGATTPSTGAFTNLSSNGTVSGSGFTSLLSPYAPLASPTLTGTPLAPTAAVGTNTTQISTTAFVNSNQSCISIMAYGGSGNGSTNNSTAFTNALAALPTNGGCIYFPAGNFNFTSAVSFTYPTSRFSLKIVGAGQDATTLTWPTGNGITLNASSPFSSFHVDGLTFATGAAGSGYAIQVNNSSPLGEYANNDLNNVSFRGTDGGGLTDYWTYGLQDIGFSGFNIHNVIVYGDNSSNGHGIGLSFSGVASTSPYYAIAMNIDHSSFYSLATGINYGAYVQGITVSQSNFTGGGTGINLPAGQSGDAELLVQSSQFNTANSQIQIASALPEFQVINSNFIAGANTASLIYVTSTGSCLENAFTGNAFYGSSSDTGINIQGTCPDTTAVGNVFNNLGTGINLSGTGGWYVSAPQFNGVANPVNGATIYGNTIEQVQGQFYTTGNYTVNQIYTGNTSVTFPTTGTLATTSTFAAPPTIGSTTPANGTFVNLASTYDTITTSITSGAAEVISATSNTNNGAAIELIGNGSSNPNKYIESANGVFYILNSASSQAILTLTDSGDLAVAQGLDYTPIGHYGPSTIAGTTINANTSLTVGVGGSTPGNIYINNATSGFIEIQPPTGALGAVALTLPDSTGTLLNSVNGATSGANSNITSLTGLTTALPVSEGGTGTTTSTGTGSTVLSASPTFTGTESVAGITATGTASFTGTFGGSAVNSYLASKASYQSSSQSKTAPASTSAYAMQGLAGAITPALTGKVLITISGTITAPTGTTVNNGILYQISYGTGTAPANAAALTGTQVGPVQEYTSAVAPTAAADVHIPFSVTSVVSLTVGTAYWIDLAAESVTTASAMGLSNVQITAVEQ